MSSDDSFENRLRAMAMQVSQSLEANVDEVAQRLNLDPDRVRGASAAAQRWINDRLTDQEPLFGERHGASPQGSGPQNPRAHDLGTSAATPSGSAPHPLDLPTSEQGLALSGLDSGRLTMRAGSGRLVAAAITPDPTVGEATEIGNELRVRDWVTADGTVTLVGHQALLRWCRTAEGPGSEEF